MIGTVSEQLAAAATAMQVHGRVVIEHGVVRPATPVPLADRLTVTTAHWTTRAVVHAARAAAGYRQVAVGRFHHQERRAAA